MMADPEFILNAWHVGALSHEVEAEALFPRRLLDRPVLFYRRERDGTPVAMLDRCPHRFAFLSKGRRSGDDIECIYHGLRFGPDGRCTRSPYQDSPPPGAAVEIFPVVERHRMIWIWMGDPAQADPATIPDHSHMDREDMRPLLWHVQFAGNWQLGNDNLMELSHLFWLHTSSIGGWKPDAGATPGEVYSARSADGKVFSRTLVPDITRPGVFDNNIPAGQAYDQWTATVWEAPANMRVTMGAVPAGDDPASLRQPYMEQTHCITPETAGSSHYFSGFTRTFELDRDAEGDRRFVEFFRGIFEREDGPMMEDIELQMASHDLFAHHPLVLPRDRGAVLARRMVAQRLAGEQAARGNAQPEPALAG
ncbi:aromatic ring-hydroxylating dioxygenase subunit alpha [Croceibacterium xixiisoli]|nr:aromatic ring-hydroxylating dioxygenase subunit alpha [Croceibacterium xixiisoli]